MSRARRRQQIAELLRAETLPSQQALRERLEHEGIAVTQATLSRDLSDLGVVKSPSGYMLPGGGQAGSSTITTTSDEESPTLLRRMVRQELLATEIATCMVVLRTRPGWADALAAEVDRCRPEGVIGSIAGDDTIFLAVRTAADARRVAAELEAHVQQAGHGTADG
ncbi:MAG: arginine repressor [Phycisphaerales bacterium]